MNRIGLAFRVLALGAMASVLAACGSGVDSAGELAASAKSAPAVAPGPQSFVSAPIPGRYIVVFRQGVGNPAAEAANVMRGFGGQIHFTYTHAIKGFAATIPEAALQGIRRNPNVAYVEQDQTVSANEVTLDPQAIQANATWGLDRIDQRPVTLDNNYYYNYTGAGVHAFIIDTGIRSTHGEFAGRWQQGKNFVAKNWRSAPDPTDTEDCNGHGTHVAGTVGGTTYGVAKGVALIPVRVLDCRGSGSWSGVIAGIDYVAGDTRRPAVANMSLGGGASNSVDTAVNNAVAKGVTMVVAAGNDGADACNYSPARATSAITVGATGSSDARTSWSNYGTCVDIFAPGLSITSAWNTSDTATNTISGTSMASPHVAGVAALALAADSTATPAAVTTSITGTASSDVVTSEGTGSPNLLLYSLLTDTGGGTGDTGPGSTPTDPAVSAAIIGTSAKRIGRSSWRAEAAVTIKDTAENPVENATVSGTFAYSETSEARSCVTGTGSSAGSCSMTSGVIGDRTQPAVFTVTDVAGKSLQSCNPSTCTITISYP